MKNAESGLGAVCLCRRRYGRKGRRMKGRNQILLLTRDMDRQQEVQDRNLSCFIFVFTVSKPVKGQVEQMLMSEEMFISLCCFWVSSSGSLTETGGFVAATSKPC